MRIKLVYYRAEVCFHLYIKCFAGKDKFYAFTKIEYLWHPYCKYTHDYLPVDLTQA